MGNHLVGKMFVLGISNIKNRKIDDLTQEKALDILDKIGNEVISSTSLNAEFDDYLNPNEKLGRILIKAFYPSKYGEWKNMSYISDDIYDEWSENVEEPFKNRFGFW